MCIGMYDELIRSLALNMIVIVNCKQNESLLGVTEVCNIKLEYNIIRVTDRHNSI